MKRINVKHPVVFAALCALLPFFVEAEIYTATQWSGWLQWGQTENRLVELVNNAKDGDIIELQNNLTVNANLNIRKKITIRSKGNNLYTIKNKGKSYINNIHPGATLELTNIVYDCAEMRQNVDVFLLMPQTIENSTTNIARMILHNGATVKNAKLASNSKKENAVFHVKEGAVLTIREGSAILDCVNESTPGKGGAICCDYGTIIMTGGTIAGCRAKAAGGAIHTDGTRVNSADNYGINARGDIYISGGYITNNTCGNGYYGGGIYLGNSGPVLHITGTAVISNNFSGTIADDVSTYNLDAAHANRLKLVDYHDSHPAGFTYAGQLFTGWVGVRYPDKTKIPDPQNEQFGAVWEYFNGTQLESRQFFWNGDNEYRGRMVENSLRWSKILTYELPADEVIIKELVEDRVSPLYLELNDDYEMKYPVNVPEDYEIVIDLQGHEFKCDFHISNATAKVTIRDSSTNRCGKVTGHRDSSYANAFVLEGGSYQTKPKPEWIAPNRVLIGNYCEIHPYMVATKAWEADIDPNNSVISDLTAVALEQSTNEVREVTFNEDGTPDVGDITFSTGDWKFMGYTNSNLRVQVLAAPAVSNETTGAIEESGSRICLHDTLETAGAEAFGREDDFPWRQAASSHGLIKLIHITMQLQGEVYVTNAVESAYFKFSDAAFGARQRATNEMLAINVADELLNALGYNRATGFTEDQVNNTLDGKQNNGLRKWENIVTGTDENQLLLSTATEVEGGLTLNIALTDADKQGRGDTGYHVRYDLRKSVNGIWTRVGDIMTEPSFSIPLLNETGNSVDASGFYRVTTLIIPDDTLSVTNEIPSTNIVGVLEVASTLTNTLTAVPWVTLAEDPAAAEERPVTVSNYVHTPHLDHDDAIQIVGRNNVYKQYKWHKNEKKWHGSITATRNAVMMATDAAEQTITRDSAVWVSRNDPAAKPFFLIGQYASAPVELEIAGGSEAEPVCTLVPNPKINDFKWGTNPHEKDLIRIPNEKGAPLLFTWNGEAWETFIGTDRGGYWTTEFEVPAGTGFWYMRCGAAFTLELPKSSPSAE